MFVNFFGKTLQKDVGFCFYTTCEIIGYSWKAYKLAQICSKFKLMLVTSQILEKSLGSFLNFFEIQDPTLGLVKKN